MAAETGNKTLILAGAAIVAIIVAVVAVRNLGTDSEPRAKKDDKKARAEQLDTTEDTNKDKPSADQKEQGRVTSMGTQDKSAKDTPRIAVAPREFSRVDTTGSMGMTTSTIASAPIPHPATPCFARTPHAAPNRRAELSTRCLPRG